MAETASNPDADEKPERVTRNFATLAACQAAAGLLALLSLRILATRLGPEGFGRACFAEAMLAYFILLSNMGLDTLGIREVARRGGEAADYVRQISLVRLALSLAGCAALAGAGLVMPVDGTTRGLIALYGLALLPLALSLEWLFQGTQQMQFSGLFLIVREGVFVGLVATFIRGPGDVLLVPAFYGVSRSAAVLLLWGVYVRRFGCGWRPGATGWAVLLRESWPIGLSQFIGLAMYPLGTTLLGLISGPAAVGEYNAATRPLFFVLMLGGAYSMAVYPAAAGLYDRDRAGLAAFVRRAGWRSASVAAAVGAGGTLLSGPVIELLYPGGAYARTAAVFGVFSWAVGAALVNGVYSKALLACHGQRAYLVVAIFQFLVCCGVSAALIPRFGALGAAAAVGAAEVAGLAGYGRAYRLASRR